MHLSVRLIGLAGAALLCISGSTIAQISILALEGQVVPGVGTLNGFRAPVINDDGDWVVIADTSNPDIFEDTLLLSNNGLEFQEGYVLAEPVGASIHSFLTATLDNRDASALRLQLYGISGTNDTGIFIGDKLVVQKGGVSFAPEFAPGSFWRTIQICQQNNSGQLVVGGHIDDLAVPGNSQTAFVRIDLDTNGEIISEELLVRNGGVLPGQTLETQSIITLSGSTAFNDGGQLMFAANLFGPLISDDVVYLDDQLLAQDGSPSPAAGRNWKTLTSANVALNNCGDWLIGADLDGDPASDSLLVKNGAKFVQKGDFLQAIAPYRLTSSMDIKPVYLGENGAVLWYGSWDAPSFMNEGLFLDNTLIVQKGVTQVGGATIIDLGGPYDFSLSPYGEWVIFEALLNNGSKGVFAWGGGPWKGLGYGLAGTGGVTPCHTGRGDLTAGATVIHAFDNALPGSTAALVFSLTELNAPFKGGRLIPFPDFLVLGLPTGATGSLSLPSVFPPGIPAGLEIYTQFWIIDPAAPAGFSATNGLSGTTG